MTILTLNCFGVPWFSPHPAKRMRLIAEQIKVLAPDLIFLQEVFMPWHKKIFLHEFSDYPYHYLPRTGILGTGGGLCCFSRYPVTEPLYHYFTKSGYWTDLTWSDKIVEKGFMELRLEIPFCCYFFHTHLTSNYTHDFMSNNRNSIILKNQLKEMSERIDQIPLDTPVFIVGDLNVPPDSGLYGSFLKDVDAYDLTFSAEPSVQGNYYRLHAYFDKSTRNEKVDCILLRGRNGMSTSWKYVMQNKQQIFSDHLGILVEFRP